MLKKYKKTKSFIKPTSKLKKINQSNINLEEIFKLDNYLLDVNLSKKIPFETSKIINEELAEFNANETYSNYFKKVLADKKNQPAAISKANINISPYLLDLRRELNGTTRPAKKYYRPLLKFNLNLSKKQIIKNINLFSIKLKFAINFLLICLLILSPLLMLKSAGKFTKLNKSVFIQSAQAITDIRNATTSIKKQDWQAAISNFNQAAINFQKANDILNQPDWWWQLTNYLPIINQQINSIKNILQAGEKLSEKGSSLTNLYQNFSADNNLIMNFNNLTANLNEITNEFIIIKNSLNKLNFDLLPANVKNNLINYQDQINNLDNTLIMLKDYFSTIQKLLGFDQKMNYLVFFQNNNELRATGGFLGSFALITIENGKVTNLEIPGGGPYDLKYNSTKKIIAPAPMHLVGTRWQIWDANWWPDFPTSAQQIMKFYEASGGMTVDGLITINADLLPQLLNITDDIKLDKYGQVLTADNIISTLQYSVEYDYDKDENKPKQIIADLAPILIDQLLKTDWQKFPSLLNILTDSLTNKDIQFYFSDQQLEQAIINFGWGGQLKDSSGDYLMVVSQNIGGGKTDGVIQQNINLTSEVLSDGSIIDKLIITRDHQGNIDNLFEKTHNVSYLRIYLPENIQILEASGNEPPPLTAFKAVASDFQEDQRLKDISGSSYFDEQQNVYLSKEFNKTVIGVWSQLKPGETKSISLKYQLPFRLNQVSASDNLLEKLLSFFNKQLTSYYSYNLLVQKQSGTKSNFVNEINFPANFKIKWLSNNSDKNTADNHQIKYQKILTSDYSLASIIEW